MVKDEVILTVKCARGRPIALTVLLSKTPIRWRILGIDHKEAICVVLNRTRESRIRI